MFEGDSADTCARKFPLMLMGGRANGQACADGKRGPPLAWAEFDNFPLKKCVSDNYLGQVLHMGGVEQSATTTVQGETMEIKSIVGEYQMQALAEAIDICENIQNFF